MNNFTTLLSRTHRHNHFECGKPQLDLYLKKLALTDIATQLEACFVWTPERNHPVAGYYTLTNSRIDLKLIPRDLRRKLPHSFSSIPVTLISKLAIDKDYQAQGYGALLLIDALKRSYETSKTIGSFAVVVHPIDANSEQFYRHYGFIRLSQSGKMFMVIKTVKQLFNKSLV